MANNKNRGLIKTEADGMFWLQHKVQPSSRTERSCPLLGGSQQGAEREISNAVDLLQRVLVRQTARAQ